MSLEEELKEGAEHAHKSGEKEARADYGDRRRVASHSHIARPSSPY